MLVQFGTTVDRRRVSYVREHSSHDGLCAVFVVVYANMTSALRLFVGRKRESTVTHPQN